jgi:hypothetical protein
VAFDAFALDDRADRSCLVDNHVDPSTAKGAFHCREFQDQSLGRHQGSETKDRSSGSLSGMHGSDSGLPQLLVADLDPLARGRGPVRVEAVSSHAVAKTFLGHSDENVTDTYILPSLDEVRSAINRAARSIDGDTPAGAIPFPIPSHQPSHPPLERTANTERSVSHSHGYSLIPEPLATTISAPAKVAELVDAQVSEACG